MTIKIIYRRYAAGTADLNRLLAYIKAFSNLDCIIVVYFLITQDDQLKHNVDIPNVRFEYMWDKMPVFLRKHKKLCYIINLLRSRLSLNGNDVVFLYEPNVYKMKVVNFMRKGPIFYEFTEHLTVGGAKPEVIKKKLEYCRKASGISVISKKLKDLFASQEVLKENICVSNMFVDADRFENISHDTKEDYIAYCGTVSIHKDGVDDLIKAYSIFHKTFPSVKLKILGSFDYEESRITLTNLCEELGIVNHVIFTGKVDPSEMPHMLGHAKLLALARPNNVQAQYGFPTKLGEYLATGVPVIVTNVGEIGLFIKDNQNGFLVPPDNYESFASKMIDIFTNYQSAKQIGLEGKRLTQTEFSPRVQAEKLVSFMKSHIDNN